MTDSKKNLKIVLNWNVTLTDILRAKTVNEVVLTNSTKNSAMLHAF